jgi:hypothetical protein
VPGKTYEYLASGRPILAAVPEGDTRDILTAAGNARFAAPDDTDSIAAGIASEIERWSARREPPQHKTQVVERYGRRSLAAEFAAVLDAVIDLAPRSFSRRRAERFIPCGEDAPAATLSASRSDSELSSTEASL